MSEQKDSSPPEIPTGITDACSHFLDENASLLTFIGFVANLAMDQDEARKTAIKALYEKADPAKYENEVKNVEDSSATKRLKSYSRLIFEMMICRAVDNYLCYISDLLSIIFRTKPETLRSNEKVSLKFILQHTSMDELIYELIDRRVNQLSYQGMRDLDDDLSKKLGFQLFADSESREQVVRIIESRNLIVHGRGIVNQIFLDRVRDFQTPVGQKIPLDVNTTFRDVKLLQEHVSDTDLKAIKKFHLPTIEILPDSSSSPD